MLLHPCWTFASQLLMWLLTIHSCHFPFHSSRTLGFAFRHRSSEESCGFSCCCVWTRQETNSRSENSAGGVRNCNCLQRPSHGTIDWRHSVQKGWNVGGIFLQGLNAKNRRLKGSSAVIRFIFRPASHVFTSEETDWSEASYVPIFRLIMPLAIYTGWVRSAERK